jgi:hypothetical protein
VAIFVKNSQFIKFNMLTMIYLGRYVACTLFHCLSDPVLDANHVASLVALAVQGCSDADDEAVKHHVSALCACCNSGGGSDSSSMLSSSILAAHAHPLLLRLQLLLSASSVSARVLLEKHSVAFVLLQSEFRQLPHTSNVFS